MDKSKGMCNPFLILAVMLGLILFILLLRNVGLYPSVFADEYTYSKFSRLLPLSESAIPAYVYLGLYRIANFCGDEFLGCAKIINTILFVSAAPFVFLICRNVASNSVSLFISILAIIGPINSYTAYFMPESFYYLGFWVFCWCLFSLDFQSKNYRWLVAGAIYGISALIKPHSIFFLPATLLYIAFVFYQGQSLLSKQSVIAFTSFIIGAVLAKFVISYVLAGPEGLTIFGPLYGSIAASTASGVDKYINLIRLALESFKGHMLVVSLIYGVPLSIAMNIAVKALFVKKDLNVRKNSQEAQLERVSFLSLLVIFNLIFVVTLFTASVANSGPYETPYRLHVRYYNFALPLFYIIVAGALSINVTINKYGRYAMGLIVVAMSVYAIVTNMSPYTPSYVDSPEIRGIYVHHYAFQIISAILILALISWVVFGKRVLWMYLYVALPIFVSASSFAVSLEQRNNRLRQDVYDRAGVFVRQYLGDDDISKVVVVGSEAAGLFRSLFYLDNAKVSLDIISEEANYDLSKLSLGKEWVLLIGNHDLKGCSYYQMPMGGFSLVRLLSEIKIDFKKGVWPGIIYKTDGLSSSEHWGTWSDGDLVRLEFLYELPEKFELIILAAPFGPNKGREFVASVGGEKYGFVLDDGDKQEMRISMNNPEKSNTITIAVPEPISPKSLGVSADERNLGIALTEIHIKPK